MRLISLAEAGESSASSSSYSEWSYSENGTTPRASGNRTSVIISIDAEIAPHTSDWQRDCGRFAADRDLYGIIERGERGLRYQLDVIERHGLKAVVFLEALSAGVLGLDLLTEVVRLVQNRGHEVGLHLHTEWLDYYRRPLLGERCGRNMADFAEDDQVRLIDRGLENLSRAGASRIPRCVPAMRGQAQLLCARRSAAASRSTRATLRHTSTASAVCRPTPNSLIRLASKASSKCRLHGSATGSTASDRRSSARARPESWSSSSRTPGAAGGA